MVRDSTYFYQILSSKKSSFTIFLVVVVLSEGLEDFSGQQLPLLAARGAAVPLGFALAELRPVRPVRSAVELLHEVQLADFAVAARWRCSQRG